MTTLGNIFLAKKGLKEESVLKSEIFSHFVGKQKRFEMNLGRFSFSLRFNDLWRYGLISEVEKKSQCRQQGGRMIEGH